MDRPEHARWSGLRGDLREIRDLLALAPPDGESPRLGEFLARERKFWQAVAIDLLDEVGGIFLGRARYFTETRQHRPLTGEEVELGVRLVDLTRTMHGLLVRGVPRPPRTA
jgi:hypothetical protein